VGGGTWMMAKAKLSDYVRLSAFAVRVEKGPKSVTKLIRTIRLLHVSAKADTSVIS